MLIDDDIEWCPTAGVHAYVVQNASCKLNGPVPLLHLRFC
jgi:hypothetical protein